MMKTKKCTKCGKFKPATKFYKQSTGRDGLYPQCKSCCTAYGAECRAEPQDRFLLAFGSSISSSINGTGHGYVWWDLVDYSRADLLEHMEARFYGGMTWETYGRGGWETHHVRPIDTFSFVCPEDPEFQECWSLGNIVPMWGRDHRATHATLRKAAARNGGQWWFPQLPGHGAPVSEKLNKNAFFGVLKLKLGVEQG